jgi:hypothetical protein
MLGPVTGEPVPIRLADLASHPASCGEDVQDLMLRAMVPISLHQEQPTQASGNQDGWMIVPLPLSEPTQYVGCS